MIQILGHIFFIFLDYFFKDLSGTFALLITLITQIIINL